MKTRTNIAPVCALLCLTLAIGSRATFAQSNVPAARTLGLAGTTPSSVSGTDAIFTNPARLSVGSAGRSVSVGAFSLFAGGPLLQFNHYNDAFTSGQLITQDEGRRIVADWFGDPSLRTQKSAGVIASATPIAATFTISGQPLGVAMRTRALGNFSINGGWLDLILVGMAEPRDVPLNGFTGAAVMTDFAVSASRKIREDITVGITTRLILGQEYAEASLTSNAAISDRSLTHTFDYVVHSAGAVQRDIISQINVFNPGQAAAFSFRPNPFSVAGLGVGVDLGLDYWHTTKTNISLSITDIGSIRWSKDAATERPVGDTFYFEGIEFDLDRLRDQFENDIGAYIESKLDSLARDAYGQTTRSVGSFARPLPTAIHAGAGTRVLGQRGRVDFGTSLPLNRAIGHTSRDPRLHVGFEYTFGRKAAIPVRTGLQVGGSGAVTLGLGFGIEAGPYAFSIAIAGSPRSDVLGAGGRYAVGVSALEFRF